MTESIETYKTRWLSLFIMAILVAFSVNTFSAHGQSRGKLIWEFVEMLIEKSSNKTVKEVTEKQAVATLERLVKSHGDEVFTVFDDAGFELLKAVPKYGNDIVDLAKKASPEARRVFAQNIPELLPHARRIGVEVLELEAKCPGLAVKAIKIFGDDAAKKIGSQFPAEDIPRIIKYGESAIGDVPATRRAMLEAYEKEGKAFFERITPAQIRATGLSIAMIGGTGYFVHRGTLPAKALADAIKDSPEVASSFIFWAAIVAGIIVLIFGLVLMRRFGLTRGPKKQPSPSNVRIDEDLSKGIAPDPLPQELVSKKIKERRKKIEALKSKYEEGKTTKNPDP